MATIIDALVVTLGLDPKNFKKGAKETDDGLKNLGKSGGKAGKDIEAAGKKAALTVANLRNEVLRTGAALLGMAAIKSFVASVTQSDAALGRMAHNLDTTTENLSAWQGVAERTGGSAAGMAGALKGLSQAVQRFSLTGEGGEVFKYFRAIGVAVTDARGKMRSYDDILLEVADKLQGMDPAKAQAIGAGMGFDEGTVNTLMQGRAALVKLLDAQREMNVRTDEDTKNAIARDNAWKNLKDTFNRIATDILNGVTPALVGLLNFIRDHAGPTAALVGAMTAALTAMSLVRFGGLLGALAQLGGAFAGAAGQAGLLASVAGKLGLWGAAATASGTLAYMGTTAALDATGGTSALGRLGGWIWDKVNGNGPSMAGGYVPGTKKGLGNTGGGDKAGMLRSLEQQLGLPAGLLDAVWKQESGRGKNMVSRAGAVGDFQFMSDTAAQYGVTDRMNFEQSARGAARMYADLLKQFHGDVPSALAAYNWGAGNVQRQGLARAPLETQNYVRSIQASMRGGQGGDTNTATTHIHGDVVVQTQATDARGIASDIHTALADQDLATQANTGLY